MIDTVIDVLGILVIGLYGLVFLWAMSRVFAISNDTRAMVVLLRRSLDQHADDRPMKKGDDDEQS